ncbi:MAG: hypothetical protein HN413_11425 [Chloroflexi bacterium]|jgi:hypothetical protein|nr:hypothetical protein [Chloroflexota bacterium]
MTIDQNTKLEILAEHYNETFELQKSHVTRRDRLFIYILGLILFLLIYMQAPNAIGDWINSYIVQQVANGQENSTPANILDVSFIGAILWFGLLSLVHTYFQTVLHIERQYNYIYGLEKELSAYFDGNAFVREGKHYKKHKLKFSRLTKVIYWNIFPALLLSMVALWLRFVVMTPNVPTLYKIIEIVISGIILISEAFYLLALYKKR